MTFTVTSNGLCAGGGHLYLDVDDGSAVTSIVVDANIIAAAEPNYPIRNPALARVRSFALEEGHATLAALDTAIDGKVLKG